MPNWAIEVAFIFALRYHSSIVKASIAGIDIESLKRFNNTSFDNSTMKKHRFNNLHMAGKDRCENGKNPMKFELFRDALKQLWRDCSLQSTETLRVVYVRVC
jgi:hypothetical protein